MNHSTIKTTKTRPIQEYLEGNTLVPGFSYRLCLLLATCNVHGKGFLKNAAELTDVKQAALRRWLFDDHIPATTGHLLLVVQNIARSSDYLQESQSFKYSAWLLFGDDVLENPTSRIWKKLVKTVEQHVKEVIEASSPSPLDDWNESGIKAFASSTLEDRVAKGMSLDDKDEIKGDILNFILRLKYGSGIADTGKVSSIY